MFLEPVEPFQVANVVNKLKPKMSSGPDEIPTEIIKESINYILIPIAHIINRSLLTGCVPMEMKVAKFIPIFKASDPSLLHIYRSVSMLPSFSKVIERIMFHKIMSFLKSNNILYEHQYGFLPKHSTIHLLLHLINTCAKTDNLRHKEMTLTIQYDLSKAFHVINHGILIRKIEFYGIRATVKDWIIDYLTDRAKYVPIDSQKSEQCNIQCLVPRGLLLGPLLYLIYINDIANSRTAKVMSSSNDTSSDANTEKQFKKQILK